MKKRVVVEMSGGVDSSTAAAILLKQGYEVVGVTMQLWPAEYCGKEVPEKVCCSLEGIEDARRIAYKLKVPHYVVNLQEPFKDDVIDYFVNSYIQGTTPNPCIICNEKIKFGIMFKKAKELNADYIATGHYARVEYDNDLKRYLLKEGRDQHKDQSYFLFSLNQEQLSHCIFPIGELKKEKTRQLALEFGIKTHNKPQSQDICFSWDKSYQEFLTEKMKIKIKPGPVYDKTGKLLGAHKGIMFYTIGQRKGLGISSKTPLYVMDIDKKNNAIIVGPKKDLLKKVLFAKDLNWIFQDAITEPLKVKARIRYMHPKQDAIVERVSEDEVKVTFALPQEAPTPGQAVVFYDDDVVVGGGWIKSSV